ncbi:Mut7-C RNAse domain-containing protein [Geodermatophilus sp. URMC 63]
MTVVDDALRPLLPARDRAAGRRVLAADPDATVGHRVQAAGVLLTEAGRPPPGATVAVQAAPRPQPEPAGGFLLDAGLGALARRMRLLGLDTAWSPEARAPDADDAEPVAAAVTEDRVLLTQDRGLLVRRALPAGAWVRGATPDDRLADVLDRFRPALAPLTRCSPCNGTLAAVGAAEVADRLEPGTRRTATDSSCCTGCGRVHWRGAHARRIDPLVERARRLTGG